MKQVVVVGSGASAVHFAQTVLERGWRVLMLDVGRRLDPPFQPELSFRELIDERVGAPSYFLGESFSGVTFPGGDGEFYGFAPHRQRIFDPVPEQRLATEGFEPLASFARGGLAEAWTGGSFPFNDAELAEFPFGHGELAPHYDEVARRIGVAGAADDLAAFLPVHAHLDALVEPDEHSRRLLEAYAKKRATLRAGGVHLGRSRVALLREDRPESERRGCTKLGRCLWGCPSGALYAPSQTLAELQRDPAFEYRDGLFVTHFELERERVVAVHARDRAGAGLRVEVERLVLGAGTLGSAQILLESVRRGLGEDWVLEGLMDNRQALVPFLNLGLIGQRYDPDTYQYHQVAMGLEEERPEEYVHGLVTTLKTALVHPVVQSVPLDLRTALFVFRHLHAALGLVNVNWHDRRRPTNTLRLDPPEPDGAPARLRAHYAPAPDEPERLRRTLARVRRALRRLGCLVPPGMTHVRPMGASVHYAGTLPMSSTPAPRTTDATGRSHDFPNLWFVDGSTFPFLPAKNLTFTLMANAARIAHAAF